MFFKKVSLLVLLSAIGCAHHTNKIAEVKYPIPTDSNEARSLPVENAVAQETGAKYFVEIQFDKGSANLSEKSKESVHSIINEANTKGVIDELVVLSWSDSEYPSRKINKLPKGQRKLADRRNQSVEKYAKSIRDIDVNTYNMAEKPNAISKLLDTTDRRIKDSLLEAGLTTSADAKQYASKASHSVILIKLK